MHERTHDQPIGRPRSKSRSERIRGAVEERRGSVRNRNSARRSDPPSRSDRARRASLSAGATPTAFLSRLLRLFVIWRTLFGEYRAYRRFLREEDSALPDTFVDRLITLGPAFVKLGQILSTRPDVLPQAYVDALSRLQERAPEVPSGTIRSVVEQELGEPIETLFANFDPTPVAAASLAQVHRAVLPDGTMAAVKVQRPAIDELVRRDLDALEWGLRVLARVVPKRMRRTNLLGFFAEFRRYTLGELDFANEGRVIERFRANFQGYDGVRFPRVFERYTTRRVLTMEWAEGMRLHAAAATLSPQQREALVSRLIDVLMKMFVSDGLFHADLHPGNIFFHADGSFTLLDFGMYGELTGLQRDRLILYWLAVVQRQTRRAFYHFKCQTEVLPEANEAAFFARFAALAERFYRTKLIETSFTKVYLDMMTAGYEHGFVFPSELMLHAKALTTAEALIFVLAPGARFDKISRASIAREYVARTASIDLIKRRVSQLAPELLLLGEVPPPQAIDDAWDWDATAEVAGQLREQPGDAMKRLLDRGGLWKTLLEADARSVLGKTSLANKTEAVLAEMWDRYYGLEPSVPIERNLGAVFTTHLAALTLGMHETLLRNGVDKSASYRLIHEIGWKFYTKMGEPPLLFASAFTRDPAKRLRLATDLFRFYPFGPPGYAWRDVPSAENVIAFDCTRCAVAEFFAKHGASELCVETWCQLDFPLAKKWGGRLERTGTIAMGKDHCDFRWHVEGESMESGGR
jgi:ubiquinone biosynthesis protein